MFEKRNVYNNPIEAILNLIISPTLFFVFGLIWSLLFIFSEFKHTWIFGALSLLFLLISIYSILNEFLLFKWEKKGFYLKFRETLKIPIISFLIFVLILSTSFFVWFRINNPPDYHGRNTIEVKILGDNEGENILELDIYIDYERLYPLKSKINSNHPDQDFPIWFHMNMTSNVTILFSGLNANQIYHYSYSDLNIFPYLENTAFTLVWYKDIVGEDYKWVSFWLDGAITYPDARLLAFNLDIREIDQFQVDKNYTITTDLELIFKGIENKDVRIESSNFHFTRLYNTLNCDYFPDVNYIPWTSTPETITNIDLDFSTSRSRRRYDSSLILLALVIEYPIIRISEFYKDWRDKETGKKKKATSKQKKQKSTKKKSKNHP